MSQHVPSWLAQPQQSSGLPDWLTVHIAPEPEPVRTPRTDTPEGQALLFVQYETFLPRILEMIASGWTLKKAFKNLPMFVDHGGFLRWLKKNPNYYSMYKEAKELRTESWADEIIRHAEGVDENGNETLADTSRSRLIVDTYWKLMGADHRKQYGDTKTIEVAGTISVTAALAEAQGRAMSAKVIDAEVIEATSYQLLEPGNEDDDD